jgi:antitoxin (DNA-binding transcriptional repressor) of toxin-antitoxin stability system
MPKRCETCYASVVKTFSVRDLRQRWPEAEALLRTEREIVITRDSKPVAKLVRFTAPTKPRKRFDPVAHGKWQHKQSGGRVSRWSDRALAVARADRPVRSDRT